MKYEVKLRLSVHARSPQHAIDLVMSRLQKRKDPAKINWRRMTVTPAGALRSSGSWESDRG